MILLREIQTKDLSALEQGAQIPGFINLPNDPDVLREKIQASMAAFQGKLKNKADCKYWFVAEDMEARKVVGTSMIAAQHGTAKSPHFYFDVGVEKKFSNTINTGFLHGTLELKQDTDGPSEIGGLVVYPEHRNTPERIGRQISFVRFLFLGLNRGRFKSKVIAELLPPLNKKGQSPLWEAIGRRFTNMDYWEADQLCQKDKEFIWSLFPTFKIYTTFFSAEARNAIGKVGKDTEPVYHMLTRIGFKYVNQVDPFDGGPHLWADAEDIKPIRGIKRYQLGGDVGPDSAEEREGLLCAAETKPGEFRAVTLKARVQGDALYIPDPSQMKAVSQALTIRAGDAVQFMPYYLDAQEG
jgi:arginine N-succinyltransferase